MKQDNEKQAIEEMANFLWKNTLIHTEDLCHDVAETCITEGYRKQSEWISVEERLPKRMEPVLVCVKGYLKKHIMVASEMLEENGARWSACAGFTVTHWMPLPEPPKMKGGE